MKKLFLILYILLVLLFAVACNNGSRVIRLSVEKPAIAFPDGIQYRFLWHNGDVIKEHIQSNDTMKLIMPAIPALVILVYPVYKNFYFYPAAVLYTYGHTNSYSLVARWKDGAAGEIFFRVLQDHHAAMHLNIIKLLDMLGELEDPWTVDIDSTANLILAEDRRGSPIKKYKKEEYSLRLPLGRWIPDNPFSETLISDGKTSIDVALIPSMHGYLEEGGKKKLYIRIDTLKNIQIWDE